jgi:hypothetical protein
MNKLTQFFKNLLVRPVRFVEVANPALTTATAELKEELLINMLDLAKTKPQVLQYIMIRMQQHLNDLQRIEKPKTDAEMRIYAANVMEIMARIQECNHLISIPSLAVRVHNKRSKVDGSV